MRALVLVLTLLASSASAAEIDERVDVPPDWIKKPNYEDLNAVWPSAALKKGVSGRVTLGCQITVQGLLEACTVESEKPAGLGFGAAALLLVPSFVLKPGMRDGKPVSTTVRIPIAFGAMGPVWSADVTKTPMVSQSVWDRAPSFADMAAAWPKKATADFGHVSMRCGFTREGTLRDCEVLTETPRGQGFGTAARELVAPRFKSRVSPGIAADIAKAYVNLPIRFTNPRSTAARTIVKPRWITSLDPQKVFEIYPEPAIKAGVSSGRGVADCLVAPDGKLTDCKPAPATPPGLGFSEAAAQVASVMVMNPWSDGGGPVDGVRLRLPVVFNLAPEEAVAK